MSDYVEAVNPWGNAGGRTTTEYAMGGKNEFGQRVPPKPVFNLHGVQVPSRSPIDPREVADLVGAFVRVTGALPTELRIAGPKQATTGRSFTIDGRMVILTISYEAKETHVA